MDNFNPPRTGAEAASILTTRGTIRLDLGEYEAARRDAVSAFDALEEVAEPGMDEAADRQRVRALCLMGRSYLQAGEYQQARPWLERALTMAHYWLREPEEDKRRVLELLGTLSRYASLWDEAVDYYREALELAEQLHGPFHAVSAGIRHQIALLAEGWEDGDLLLEDGQRAYDIRCSLFGSTHPLTAAAQTGLALALQAGGRQREAGEKFLHAISVFDRYYACPHLEDPVSVETLRDYAICRRHAVHHLLGDGRGSDAREFALRAQGVFERTLGKQHPLVKQWRKECDALFRRLPRGAGKQSRYSAWDWWRGFSFSR